VTTKNFVGVSANHGLQTIVSTTSRTPAENLAVILWKRSNCYKSAQLVVHIQTASNKLYGVIR